MLSSLSLFLIPFPSFLIMILVTLKLYIADETAICRNPKFVRSSVDQHLSIYDLRTVIFCGHTILTEDVFVTQVSSNSGISFWRIVRVTTNCPFMSNIFIFYLAGGTMCGISGIPLAQVRLTGKILYHRNSVTTKYTNIYPLLGHVSVCVCVHAHIYAYMYVYTFTVSCA